MVPERPPFEVVVLIFCALTGLIGLLTGSTSPVPINLVYGGWGWLWNVGVLAGGAGSLIALWCRMPLSFLLERVGMVWLGTMFGAYSLAILLTVADYPRGVVGVGTSLALAVACLVRAVQLSRQLTRLRAALGGEL